MLSRHMGKSARPQLVFAVALGFAAGACAAQKEEFRPAEKATAISPQGYTAAEYDLKARQGGDLGEAKVWSNGAKQVEVRGDDRTVVHVGFTFENNGDTPLKLQLDRTRADVGLKNEGGSVTNLQAAQVEGDVEVSPGQERQVALYFVLPQKVAPNDINAFRVRWTLANGTKYFSQSTPFVEKPEPRGPRYYYSPFYDPFFHNRFVGPGAFSFHGYPYSYPWYF